MSDLIHKAKLIIRDTGLRNRILFILFALVLFRALAAIPVPGVDTAKLHEFFAGNQFLGMMNIFSGSGLSNFSLVMLGVAPYITASIIMQLSTVMSEKLKAMYHEDGEIGRKKFTQYSRLITVPLAVIQGFGLLTVLQRQGVIDQLSGFDFLLNITIITAGSVLLMWIGELISEFGIGNGVSIIIFAGIVASIPTTVSQLVFTFDVSQIPLYIGLIFTAVVITAGVVTITESERPIPVTYSKRVRGQKVYGGTSTYLPLRVNQAGVMPIIFAISFLILPQMLMGFLANVSNPTIQSIASAVLKFLENGLFYSILYFVLVFLFTYFYTAITFDPHAIATNLQKSGAFVPGVRPGKTTEDYIAKIITRITLVGALFLGGIAVLPLATSSITGNTALAVGGTALLIVVSVVLDLVKKIEAQISMREY